MLACFDASGHESDQPYLVVAGFVSSAGDWDDFSVRWTERLRADGLPYFHAQQFASSTGIFDGWKDQEAKRRALGRDLMEVVAAHAYRWFMNGVQPSDMTKTFSDEERRQFHINGYALCGRTCVADLGRWLRGEQLEWNTRPPDLVFEDGDIGKGLLQDLLVKHNYPAPQFLPGKKPKTTALGVVEPFVPLQAADWLAYEGFRLLKQGTNDRSAWRWAMREFFQHMQGCPGFWMDLALERIKDDLAALDAGHPAPVVLPRTFADGQHFA
jgi:hypothetical protein